MSYIGFILHFFLNICHTVLQFNIQCIFRQFSLIFVKKQVKHSLFSSATSASFFFHFNFYVINGQNNHFFLKRKTLTKTPSNIFVVLLLLFI